MNKPYDLDDGVNEYFEFILKGHLYHFRYPSTDEIDEIAEIKTTKQMKETLSKFITKGQEDAPEFTEITEQLTIPHWARFRDMIIKEMSLNEDNPSTKDS